MAGSQRAKLLLFLPHVQIYLKSEIDTQTGNTEKCRAEGNSDQRAGSK